MLRPALALLLVASLAPASGVAAEDTWVALLAGHLGALPAEAVVNGAVVPLGDALAGLRGMALPHVSADLAPGSFDDLGFGARSGSAPCDVAVMVAAIKRGSGPVQELFVNERIEAPAPLPGGVVGCGTGFAWSVGTGRVDVVNAPDLWSACYNPTAGAWAQEASNCHTNDFASASLTGRVGFASFLVQSGEAWVRIERMFGGVHGWVAGPAQADAAVVTVAAS